MIQLKIISKVGAAAEAALEPHIPRLYATEGLRMVAIVELKQDDKNSPSADSDTARWVKAKITHLEVPGEEQEGIIREAMRALYLQRTARGTLTEDGHIELSEETLRLTAGMLHAVETARLRAGLDHWAGYMRRLMRSGDLTLTEMRHELDTVADGLTTLQGHALDAPAEGE
jgi:hypothetical protein